MSVPISTLVSVISSVLAAGGSAVVLNGLVLTENAALPYGAPLSFTSQAAVAAYFGSTSDEANMATVYFNGFAGSTQKPGTMLFGRYAGAAISAFTRGGANALTLSQIQAITAGVMSVTVDGVVKSSSSIDLSTATSFSDAAALLTTALGLTGGAAVTYDSNFSAFVITSGTTGGTSTMTYASGATATSLSLTQAAGAVLSQGHAADTPSAAMTAITSSTQNWACFTSVFEPDQTDKEAFSTWTAATAGRYAYCPWDTDATIAGNPSSYTGFGKWLETNNVSGTCPWYNDKLSAAFALGFAASIDFAALNGRATIAYKSGTGLEAVVTDATVAANVEANGFNYYGAFATANDSFVFAFPGQISGAEGFFDNYLDDLWMASSFQGDLIGLLTSQATKSIPYNAQGYALAKAALQDTIQAAINFGAIRKGVTLSSAQAAEVDSAAGLSVSGNISRDGYYLQIKDPTAEVRAARGTPVINFWYTNGESIQRVTLNSFNIL